jgi:hypothetical protein
MLVPKMKTLAQSLVLTGAFTAGVNSMAAYCELFPPPASNAS